MLQHFSNITHHIINYMIACVQVHNAEGKGAGHRGKGVGHRGKGVGHRERGLDIGKGGWT